MTIFFNVGLCLHDFIHYFCTASSENEASGRPGFHSDEQAITDKS